LQELRRACIRSGSPHLFPISKQSDASGHWAQNWAHVSGLILKILLRDSPACVREDSFPWALRAAEALTALLDLGPAGQEALQKTRLALTELMTVLGLENLVKEIPEKFTGFGISYGGMTPREAGYLDLE
jgi:hypothetical protein